MVIVLILLLTVAAASADETRDYVGSLACAKCHKNVYDAYVKTAMGRSLVHAGSRQIMATVPSSAAVRTAALDREFLVSAQNGRLYQTERRVREGTEVFSTTHALEYAVGSGVNGITFLVRRGAYLFQAPLSYYSRTRSWELSPGYETVDQGFSRPVADACLACHAGRIRPVAGRTGMYESPPFDELAIGCENCHGPGAVHASNAGRSAIVNPRRLPARLAEDICARCHQTGDTRVLKPRRTYNDFRPGEPLSNTLAIFRVTGKPSGDEDLLEHHSAMQMSRCFEASAGRLGCLTCHNPHEMPTPKSALSFYRQKCFTCHNDSSCVLSRKERAANDCIQCHMPRRPAAGIAHSALTNHRIVRVPGQPAPERTLEAATGDLPGLTYWNRPAGNTEPLPVLVRLIAYGELMDRFAHLRQHYLRTLDEASAAMPDDPVVLAALGRKALAEMSVQTTGILTRAIEAGSAAPTTFLDLGESLSREGKLDESIAVLRRGINIHPFAAAIRKSLILRLIAKKDYDGARSAMTEYLSVFPEDSFVRGLLDKVSRPAVRR